MHEVCVELKPAGNTQQSLFLEALPNELQADRQTPRRQRSWHSNSWYPCNKAIYCQYL